MQIGANKDVRELIQRVQQWGRRVDPECVTDAGGLLNDCVIALQSQQRGGCERFKDVKIQGDGEALIGRLQEQADYRRRQLLRRPSGDQGLNTSLPEEEAINEIYYLWSRVEDLELRQGDSIDDSKGDLLLRAMIAEDQIKIALTALDAVDKGRWVDGKKIYTDEANEICEIAATAAGRIRVMNEKNA